MSDLLRKRKDVCVISAGDHDMDTPYTVHFRNISDELSIQISVGIMVYEDDDDEGSLDAIGDCYTLEPGEEVSDFMADLVGEPWEAWATNANDNFGFTPSGDEEDDEEMYEDTIREALLYELEPVADQLAEGAAEDDMTDEEIIAESSTIEDIL